MSRARGMGDALSARMNWERRLREMILAGGALASAACSSGKVVSADADTDGNTATGNTPMFCCNGGGDPCCYLPCNPDAAITPECAQEQACEADGGTWQGPPGVPNACAFPADAGPQDDASDGMVQFSSGCCNANGDPCCPYLYCDAALTTACTAELACQAEGGTFNLYTVYNPDGSVTLQGCSLSSDPRPPDARPDADGDGSSD